MAIPLFVLRNERNKTYKQRRLLESLSAFEVLKHCGLPWWCAREIFEWLEPFLEPLATTNNAVSSETKVLTALGFYRSGEFQWLIGTSSGTSQPTCSRLISEVSNALVDQARAHIFMPNTGENVQQIQTSFYEKSGLQNILGIVDGTHVF